MSIKVVFLATSDIALEIVNADDIHLVLDVFEKDVMNIKTGQKINFDDTRNRNPERIKPLYLSSVK